MEEQARERWTDLLSTAALDRGVQDALLEVLLGRAGRFDALGQGLASLLLHLGSLDPSRALEVAREHQDDDDGYGRPRPGPALVGFVASLLDDDETALPAVRLLWSFARNGNDLSAHHDVLRVLIGHDHPHVRFFSAMALACGGVDRPEMLAVARTAENASAADPPDISERSRYASYVSTFSSTRCPPPDDPGALAYGGHPRAASQPCGVCAGQETALVEHELSACNAGRYELWRYWCRECRCCTVYVHDD